MICGIEKMERRGLSELLDRRFKKTEFTERITRTAQIEHRDAYLREMFRSLRIRCSGRVKREREQHKADNVFQRSFRRGGRRHPPAERMTAREQGKIRRGFFGGFHRGPDGRDTHRIGISPTIVL